MIKKTGPSWPKKIVILSLISSALAYAEVISNQTKKRSLQGDLLATLRHYDGKLGDINVLVVGNKHHGFLQGAFSLPIDRLKSSGLPRHGMGVGYRYLFRSDSSKQEMFLGGYLSAHAKEGYWFHERANIDGGIELATENLQGTLNGYSVYQAKDVANIYTRETSWGLSIRLSTYYWQKMLPSVRINLFSFGAYTQLTQEDKQPSCPKAFNGGFGIRWELIHYTDIALETKFVWDTLKTGKRPNFQFGLHVNFPQRSDSAGNHPVHRLKMLPQRYRPDYDCVDISFKIGQAIHHNDSKGLQKLLDHPGFKGYQDGSGSLVDIIKTHCSENSDIVDAFLGHPKIDLNQTDCNGDTPLTAVIMKGDIEGLKKLLACKKTDVNREDSSQNTPLHKAVKALRQNHSGIVKALLGHPKIDVNRRDLQGEKPLTTAILNGSTESVEALLAHSGIDLNQKNRYGETLLAIALQRGYSDIVEVLLGHPEINQDILKALLGHPQIDVNREGPLGNTPLIAAICRGHNGIVEALLGHPEIDVNREGPLGNTPLIAAICRGHNGIVEALLGHPEIDVNQKNSVGNLPLIAAICRGHDDIVEALLGRPEIDVNREDWSSDTPLIAAICRGHNGIVEALLGHPKIDVNREGPSSDTPLIAAIDRGHDGIVEALLGHPKIDVNRKGPSSYTPLIAAIDRGHNGIVEALLGRPEIDVTCDDRYQTPLHVACKISDKKSCASIMKMLLEHGTSVGGTHTAAVRLFSKSLALNDESILMQLMAMGLDTQSKNSGIDLLDTITNEDLRAKMKTARANLIKTVQSLFIKENLSDHEVPERLRLISHLMNSLKVIKAQDPLAIQIDRYQRSSHKELNSIKALKASEDDYILYCLQKHNPRFFIPEIMMEIIEHLSVHHIKKIRPEQLGLKPNDVQENIERLSFELNDPNFRLSRFCQARGAWVKRLSSDTENDWLREIQALQNLEAVES